MSIIGLDDQGPDPREVTLFLSKPKISLNSQFWKMHANNRWVHSLVPRCLGHFMQWFSWCSPFVWASNFVNNLFLNTVSQHHTSVSSLEKGLAKGSGQAVTSLGPWSSKPIIDITEIIKSAYFGSKWAQKDWNNVL